VRMAAERLRSAGMEVITSCSVPVYVKGRHTRGFIDMLVIDGGIMLGVEVDRLTPRERSIQKLRTAPLDFRLIVLTHPETPAMPSPVGGIDALVGLRNGNFVAPRRWSPASRADL